jgi:hypothetical protein
MYERLLNVEQRTSKIIDNSQRANPRALHVTNSQRLVIQSKLMVETCNMD